MTYLESSQLMTDPTFRGRVKVSVLKYADSIMIESPAVPAHNARYRWAQQSTQQPDLAAQQIQSPVVMDPAVQSAGSTVTDEALQGAVEAVVNKLI